LNFVLMRRSLLRFSGNEHPTTKKQVAFSSLSRLFAITLVAVAFALLVRPDGIAVFAGLAIFQLVLGASSIVPVLKEWRKG
jgi:hypothetical protein